MHFLTGSESGFFDDDETNADTDVPDDGERVCLRFLIEAGALVFASEAEAEAEAEAAAEGFESAACDRRLGRTVSAL